MILVQSPLTALAPRALAPRALARSPSMLSRGVTRRVALLNVLGLSPAAAGASGPPDAPDADNIFGRILRGEAPAEIVDGDDPELFTFVDKRPASTVHLLVIPRRFIRDASALAPEDLPLVGRMEAKARARWSSAPSAPTPSTSESSRSASTGRRGTRCRGSTCTPSTRRARCRGGGSTRRSQPTRPTARARS